MPDGTEGGQPGGHDLDGPAELANERGQAGEHQPEQGGASPSADGASETRGGWGEGEDVGSVNAQQSVASREGDSLFFDFHGSLEELALDLARERDKDGYARADTLAVAVALSDLSDWCEELSREKVRELRRWHSWKEIGRAFGISRQWAEKKFGEKS